MRTATLTIDLYKYRPQIIDLKQGDDTRFIITVNENDAPVSLSAYDIVLNIVRPNNTAILQADDMSVDGNMLTINLNRHAVAHTGNAQFELQFIQSGAVITSYVFGAVIVPALIIGIPDIIAETISRDLYEAVLYALQVRQELTRQTETSQELYDDLTAAIVDVNEKVDAAIAAKVAAETAQGKAEGAQEAAEAAQTAAQAAQAAAEAAETNASNSATAASGSATAAAGSATAANNAKTDAQTAKAGAEAAQTAAETAQSKAEDAQEAAETAQAAAETARAGAETAKENAGRSANAASESMSSAAQASSAANAERLAAETAQGKAEDAQEAAEAAQTAAESAQAGAETAETNAGNSATSASGSATAAAGSATAANSAKTAAQAAQAAAEAASSASDVAAHNSSATAHAELFTQKLAPKADKLTEGNFTKGNILIAGEGGTFADSGYPVFMDVITDPVYIQNATRKGTMRFIADVGDSFEISRGSDILTYDFIGFDADTPADPQHTHATTVQLHDCYKNIQHDAPELLFYVNPTDYPNGLAAGTYNITLDHGAYGGGAGEDGTYQFTTAQAIPAGGGFRHTTAGAYHDGYSGTNITGGKIVTYDAARAAIESSITVTVGTGGTNLGTFSGKHPAYRSGENCNYTERNAYGSNNYEQSAIRQWLNSSAAAGAVWTPKHNFDRAPSWAATEAGFLNGIDADFLAVLGAPVKRTARSTFADGGGYVDISTDIMFLLSRGEVGGANENGINEGAPYEYYDNMLINHVRNDNAIAARIKYLSGSPRSWWLRSPFTSYSGFVRIVYTSGIVSSYVAYGAIGVAPACCII